MIECQVKVISTSTLLIFGMKCEGKFVPLNPTTHFLKNVTLSCPTGGMLPRAACYWLTKSEFASYWLTQSATYSILPPAQASTLDMLSRYMDCGIDRHKFFFTFRTENQKCAC